MTGTESDKAGKQPTMASGLVLSGIAALASATLVVFVGAVILAAGFGESSSDARSDGAANGSAADQLSVGEDVYTATCSSCHGANGEGGIGLALVGVTERIPEAADHVQIVVNGQAEMPAFGPTLTDAEIEAVVAYERSVLDGG